MVKAILIKYRRLLIVGFHTGGIPDMARPRITRMLAPGEHAIGLRAASHRTIVSFRWAPISDTFGRGQLITVGDDPRITRAGRFLRKSKIDELPQLISAEDSRV